MAPFISVALFVLSLWPLTFVDRLLTEIGCLEVAEIWLPLPILGLEVGEICFLEVGEICVLFLIPILALEVGGIVFLEVGEICLLLLIPILGLEVGGICFLEVWGIWFLILIFLASTCTGAGTEGPV